MPEPPLDPAIRNLIRARVRALPRLTDDELDRLADVLVRIRLHQADDDQGKQS